MKFVVVFLVLAAAGLTAALYIFDARQAVSKRDVDLLLGNEDTSISSVENVDTEENQHSEGLLQSFLEFEQDGMNITLEDDFVDTLHSRSPPGSPKLRRISPDPRPAQKWQHVPRLVSLGRNKGNSNLGGWVVLHNQPQNEKENQELSPKPIRAIGNAPLADISHDDREANSPSNRHVSGIDMSKIDMHAFDSASMKAKEKTKRAPDIGNAVGTLPKKGKKGWETDSSLHSRVTDDNPGLPISESAIFYSPLNSPPESPKRHTRRSLPEDDYNLNLQQRGLCGSKGCLKGTNSGSKRKMPTQDRDQDHSTPTGSHVSESPFALVSENLGIAAGLPGGASSPVTSPRRRLTPVQASGRQQPSTRQQQRTPSPERAGFQHRLDISPATSHSPALELWPSGNSMDTAQGESPRRQAISGSPLIPMKKLSTIDTPVVPPSRWAEPEERPRSSRKTSRTDSPSSSSKILSTSNVPVVPPSRWSKEEVRPSSSRKMSNTNAPIRSSKLLSTADSPEKRLPDSVRHLHSDTPVVPPSRWSKDEIRSKSSKAIPIVTSPVVPPSRWSKEEQRPRPSKQPSNVDLPIIQPSESSKRFSDTRILPLSPWSSPDRTQWSKILSSSDISSLPPSGSSKKLSTTDSPVVPPSRWSKDEEYSTSSLTKRGNCFGKHCAGLSYLLDKNKNPTPSESRKKQKSMSKQQRGEKKSGLQRQHSDSATSLPLEADKSKPLRAQTSHASYGSISDTNSHVTYARASSELSNAGSLLPPMQRGSTMSLSAWDEPGQTAGNRDKSSSPEESSLIRRGACIGKTCGARKREGQRQQQQQQQQQQQTQQQSQQQNLSRPIPLRTPSGARMSIERVSAGLQRVPTASVRSGTNIAPVPESPSSRDSETPSLAHANSLSTDRLPPLTRAGSISTDRISRLGATTATTPRGERSGSPFSSRRVSTASQPISGDATIGSSSRDGSAKRLSVSPPAESAGSLRSGQLSLPEHIPIRPSSASTEAPSERIGAWHDPKNRLSNTGSAGAISRVESSDTVDYSLSSPLRPSSTGEIQAPSRPQSASSIQPAPPFRLLSGNRSRSMARAQSAGNSGGSGARSRSMSRTQSEGSGGMGPRRPSSGDFSYAGSTEQTNDNPHSVKRDVNILDDVEIIRRRDTELVKRDDLLESSELIPRGGCMSKGCISKDEPPPIPSLPSSLPRQRSLSLSIWKQSAPSFSSERDIAGSHSATRSTEPVRSETSVVSRRRPKLARRGGCMGKPCLDEERLSLTASPSQERPNPMHNTGNPIKNEDLRAIGAATVRKPSIVPPGGCMGRSCLRTDSSSSLSSTRPSVANEPAQGPGQGPGQANTESRTTDLAFGRKKTGTRRKTRFVPRGLCLSRNCLGKDGKPKPPQSLRSYYEANGAQSFSSTSAKEAVDAAVAGIERKSKLTRRGVCMSKSCMRAASQPPNRPRKAVSSSSSSSEEPKAATGSPSEAAKAKDVAVGFLTGTEREVKLVARGSCLGKSCTGKEKSSTTTPTSPRRNRQSLSFSIPAEDRAGSSSNPEAMTNEQLAAASARRTKILTRQLTPRPRPGIALSITPPATPTTSQEIPPIQHETSTTKQGHPNRNKSAKPRLERIQSESIQTFPPAVEAQPQQEQQKQPTSQAPSSSRAPTSSEEKPYQDVEAPKWRRASQWEFGKRDLTSSTS